MAQAGAVAVLTGLVFVGVSINLEKIVSRPEYGLTGRAAEALILLAAMLTASSLLLVPGQGMTAAGTEVLAVGLAAWGWVGTIQLLRLKRWPAMAPGLRQAFVARVALGQAATLPFVIAGIAVLAGRPVGLYWLAAGMVLSIVVAVFAAWVLLIKIEDYN